MSESSTAKIVPGPCLYRTRTADGVCQEYVSSFQIVYPSALELYRWKVHIGDIIAVSTADHSGNRNGGLSLQDIEDWDPKHLQRASPHWKVGLVLALVQVDHGKTVTQECHVEWLEKALDTTFANSLKPTFRPWSNSAPRCKLPHVLLRTYTYTSIPPVNLLPVQITMLTDAEFKDGTLWNPDDRFSFHMHCPKCIKQSATGHLEYQVDPSMDSWPELNHASLKNSKCTIIPKALQLAWAKWEPVQDDDDLLQALIQGYRDSCGAKYVTYLNRKAKEQSYRYDEEQERLHQQEQEKQQKKNKNKRVVDSHVHSNKRVRISEPDNRNASNTTTKPAKSVPTKAVKSIIKKTVKPVKTKPNSPKAKKSNESVVTTPSTKSNSSISSSPLPTLHLSKTQQAITIHTTTETCIHRGKMRGETCDFYERVQLLTKPNAKPRHIVVGQVVAVVKEKKATDYEPFDCPWGVAQVLALYMIKDTEKWIMQVRWLLRYTEVSTATQQQLKRRKVFDLKQGLLETLQVSLSPIEAILPVHVEVGTMSPPKKLPSRLPSNVDYNTLPTLYFQCRFLQDEEDIIKAKNDWKSVDADSSGMKGPLQRAFGCMKLHQRVKEKYMNLLRKRVTERDGREQEETSSIDESIASLQLKALTSKPILESWGVKFHEGVRVDIDRDTLDPSFVPATTQWTVKVGYIVPVAFELDHEVAMPQKTGSKKWFPFVCHWSPAQIVSIYEDDNDVWKMQIRWFHRYNELVDGQKEGMQKFDQPHVIFETESYEIVDARCCLPGRLILSSSSCESWDVAKSQLTGLPLIPRFCSHICLDDEIDAAPDWTNYDILLHTCPVPLKRGFLLEPLNRHRKEWILTLSRCYTKHICLRGRDPDDLVLQRWTGRGPTIPLMNGTTIDFCEEKIKAEIGSAWHTQGHNGSRLYFSGGLRISAPTDYLALPSKEVRRAKKLDCNLRVGDIVAYYHETAGGRADHILMKNLKHPWFPYRVPWGFGQILTIYCENDDSTGRSPVVEIRRFYRFSELPLEIRTITPLNDDTEREEVFESDDVCCVNATKILGYSEIYLAKHERASRAHGELESSPLISCRCKYFYHPTYGRFQPLFTHGLSPETWWDRLFSRGIAYSQMVKNVVGLQEATISGRKKNDALDVQGLLGGSIVPEAGALDEVKMLPGANRRFFMKAVVPPQWLNYIDSDIQFHRNDRNHVMWEMRLGDYIALKNGSDTLSKFSTTFPFVCPWTPCQLVAVFSEASAELENLCFEVRYIKMKRMASEGISLSEIDTCTAPETTCVAAADLLGPVMFVLGDTFTSFDWDSAPKRLPCAVLFVNESELPSLEKSIVLSSSYTNQALNAVQEAIGRSGPRFGKIVSRGKNVSGCGDTGLPATSGPIFVDVSRLRVFYSEFWLDRQQSLCDDMSNQIPPEQSSWKVKTGDVVLIHCDGPRRCPFKCNWGVAEIVAVWKEFETRDDLEKDAHSSDNDILASLKVEIRWYYERHDVIGAEADISYGEVFETDDVMILDDVTAILAPAKVCSERNDFSDSEEPMNLQLPAFVCRRFWSMNRKSLIPCGDLSGREKRARLYSQNIPKGYPSTDSTSRMMSNHPSHVCQPRVNAEVKWADSVRNVIAKLNLKEASKEVYDRGETLVGREKELSQLFSFFRAAIHGQAGPGGIRSSIFLAGAPGVGKTACIRSAITSLESEQARGELPAFNFIPLNGMEMRHPFEAYMKLWEAITGKKHVGSYEKACQKLEYHFTNPKSLASNNDTTVTIVLLDEIDYLVTEKQSVLYNFFDWPKRAASVRNGRRLVVIGISNTLNLAEQLMPSVQSRVGSERIVFKAYSVTDASAILKAKISEAAPDHSIFDDDAILFAAKKTAAMSGDIRKAFQICRGAAELLLRKDEESDQSSVPNAEQSHPKVRISDVQKASRESFDSALVTAVSFSTPFQALLLVSLASLCRATGREVGGFDMTDIMTKMEALSGSIGESQYSPPPAMGETIQLLNHLAETNLIKLRTVNSSSVSFRSCGGGSGGAWPVTVLGIDEHTIVRGLKATAHKALAEKCLPSPF